MTTMGRKMTRWDGRKEKKGREMGRERERGQKIQRCVNAKLG